MMLNDKFKYYNWASSKWERKWRMSNELKKYLFTLKATIHFIPLWKPQEVQVDLENQQLVVPRFFSEVLEKYGVPKTTFYLFKYNNINNLLLDCNYIVTNYSIIIEDRLERNAITLNWSTSYGAFFFKEITNYINNQDIVLETWRTTKQRKQRLVFHQENKKLFRNKTNLMKAEEI